MSWWNSSPFDEVVEKATSELLPVGQENLPLYLEISDQIRSKKVNPKDAMRSLKKRLAHKNPNVQLATLSLVDTCVKNGGNAFLREIASREFMDELVSILKAPTGCNIDVKNKLLEIIQTWGMASRNNRDLGYMHDTYALLKAEGTQFPPVRENLDAIFLETAAAPEWSDSDVCERCRTPFTLTNRKHHCRRCGGTFCQQCSAKSLPLPQLGINEPVRVCDGCYIKVKLEKAGSTSKPAAVPSTNAKTPNIPQPQPENDFDDDLKKAIELSLKEAEQQKNSYGPGYVKYEAKQQEPAVEDDPDLAAAIAASLKDLEISKQEEKVSRDDLTSVEMENILLFSTLMDRVAASGGDVSSDPQVNQLYTQVGTLQPKLVKSLDETIRKHGALIEIHQKLNMVVKAYDRLLEEQIARHQPYTLPTPIDNNYYSQPHLSQQQQQYYPYDYYRSLPLANDTTSLTTPVSHQPEQKSPVADAPLIDL
ncbi:ubiquitin binding protein [Rhizopus microsporus var. microsporus]|uniref:Vacuolar protein sorting-associated protein 27 n=2 Tax=Rhizopus microsporus TaxID=58291 RepID=A0A2G4SSF8_RHIZD|nr:ubiquitin binding protein [Rhizopus microsporus ATCC 52813]ORE02877.1 ubiquitin binding protein [Rhizopus microsporus var. microsporus]PHZ11717.1 ubiquitin binding protein [Rhizopus microsporus ATCC 52813]